MAKPVAIGMSKLYMGPIAGDGGMGTGLTLVSYAVIDTPVFTTSEGTKTDFEIEDSDTPYYSKTAPGPTTFAASFYGLSAAVLSQFFGGVAVIGATSADPDTWEAPAQLPTYERSIAVQHTQGGHLEIVRASISATLEWAFQKNNLPRINMVATVLTPTKVNQWPYKFFTEDYTP